MLKIFAESIVPATKALRESKIEIIGTELPYLLSAEEEGLWSSSRLKDLHFYIKEIYFLSFIYFLQMSTPSYALHCFVFPRAGNSFSLFLRHCHCFRSLHVNRFCHEWDKKRRWRSSNCYVSTSDALAVVTIPATKISNRYIVYVEVSTELMQVH